MSKMVRLSDVANLTVGFVGTMAEHYVDNGVPFLRSLNVKPFSIVSDDLKYISKEFSESIAKSILHEGDIIIVRTGIPGTCAVVPAEYDGCNCSDVVIVHPNREVVDENYLAAYINIWGQRQVQNNKVGAIQKHFNISAATEMLVYLPSIEVQKKYAKIILALNKKINNNLLLCTELESMAKTIYDYWFLQFDFPDENGNPYRQSGGKMVWNEELKREIPEGWETISLQNNYFVDRGVSYTSEDIASSDGIPMLNLACVDINRKYRDGQLKYTKGNVPSDKKLHGGEMLIACTDLTRNRNIIGCPILVPADGLEYTYSMDLARVKSSNKNLLDMYLYQTLRTEFYHDYIKMWASGTNVLHLNLKGLDWYSVVLPPLEMQEIYSKIVMTVHEKYSKALAENRQLVSLRDFLLPMLMNGQARVV